MRLRMTMVALLCLGLAGCGPDGPPIAAQPAPAGQPLPVKASVAGRAEAVDDVIVVWRGSAVDVLERLTGKALWSVPQRPDDAIVKARLAHGSVVVVRRSQAVEVYDLRAGKLRYAKEKAGAVGVSWTTLYADSAACQPDCLLRAFDVETGQERWTAPKSLSGKVMVEPGEVPYKYDPLAADEGPLRAPEASVVAVRGIDSVVFIDAASGQELSRAPSPEAALALGSGNVLLEWGAAKECRVTVAGRNARSGELAWQVVVGIPCGRAYHPDIVDGLFIYSEPRGQTRAIEVDTGTIVWASNPFADPVVAASRQAIITYAQGRLAAIDPAKGTHLWQAQTSEVSTVSGVLMSANRLAYTTQYQGSPRGIGWVRDLATGRGLWYVDGATPLGVDGDRVIVELPSGEVRLERMRG